MLFYTYFHITDSRLSILGGQGNGRQGGENGRVKSENQFESNAGLMCVCVHRSHVGETLKLVFTTAGPRIRILVAVRVRVGRC